MSEQTALVVTVHAVNLLCNIRRRFVPARDFDQHRCLQHPVSELFNLIGEGGGKQKALTLLGQQTNDAHNIGDEAHIEHAVRLIEH